ncbi:hypothetical protein ACU045_03835 [Microbacterium sp. MAHUQ-60]|uniref:hypothetical protein n=1 Tax=unclassified Microbacterium TaxID=2609290 RepID=UPI003620FF5E
MDADRAPHADVDSAPEGTAVTSRLWPSLVVGAVASAFALFPSWVGGARLPLQNLWHEQTMPDDMPISLLPLSQYYALNIFVMLLLGGVLAGLVVRWRRLRAGMAALGVLGVHVIVTVQSFAVLAGGHGLLDGTAGSRELLYFGGMLGGVVAGIGLAQLGCWMASRRTVTLPALAVALSAVPVGSWISTAIVAFTTYNGYPPEVGTILRWVPAVIVAGALIWAGVRPLGRLVVWVVGLLALWKLPAVFTAISYGLGMRVLQGDLREMALVAGQIFPLALAETTLPVVVAVVLAVVGTGVRMLVGKRVADVGRAQRDEIN